MLVLVFVVSGAVIWFAGIQLSKSTDRLDKRLHLGSALGGLILLAIATNLPEIAITVTAAASGAVGIAVGNILGGIAIQTVVIAVLDRFGKREKGAPPLTYRAASLTLVVEALTVVAILALVVAGTQLPKTLDLFRVTPQALLIVAAWVLGLLLVRQAGRHLPWDRDGAAPDAGPPKQAPQTGERKQQHSLAATVGIFLGAAGATLVAGFFLEQSGDAASSQIGLSGILFGATVLALATSLPEISTGLQSMRQGDESLAISDIFGGNAFLPVLFLIAGLISGQAVLPQAGSADIYLTAIAALLTAVYAFGLLFRPKRRVLGMGIDSIAVVILYLIGIGGLFAISR
ncbi:sodium:calcium antiporter [Glaciihabitans sp. UYNi722]|uniref:sodium:calcium antiporter n=1 Tax=Glaciihabitans sp. UYNi722 TaxID=3156344 RepID=UPI00339817BD